MVKDPTKRWCGRDTMEVIKGTCIWKMQGSALTCQAKEIRRVKAASPLEKQTGNNQIVGQLKRRGELYSMESEKQKQRQELPWFSQRMRSSWFQHKSTFCNTKKKGWGWGGRGRNRYWVSSMSQSPCREADVLISLICHSLAITGITDLIFRGGSRKAHRQCDSWPIRGKDKLETKSVVLLDCIF